MHTVENKRYSYLNDRHLAMIEVYTVGDSLASCGDCIGHFYSRRTQTYSRPMFLSAEKQRPSDWSTGTTTSSTFKNLSTHAHFENFRLLNLKRMLSTENLYSQYLQSEGRYFSSERGDSRKHVSLRKLFFIQWYIFSVVGIVNMSDHISKPEKCEFCLIYFSPCLLFAFQNVREASTLQLRHYYKVRTLLRTLCDLVDLSVRKFSSLEME